MKPRTPMLISATILFAALASPVWLCAQHTRYKLIDLGTFGGPNSSVFVAEDNYDPVLNNRGTVAGQADTSAKDPFSAFCFIGCNVSHSFQWRNGVMTDLGVLPGGASSASAWISANGLIAGWSENGLIDPLFPDFPESHAVLWKHGEIEDLGTLEGGHESVALAVNSRGQVVGAAANGVPDSSAMAASNFGWTTQTRAFLWQDGTMQDLGTLGGPDAVALLVNERGQIAGDSYTSSAPSPSCIFPLATGGFLWENGNMTDLGSFGGTCTFVFDLNNRGQVVGASRLAGDQVQHPFLWDRGVLKDLGTFGGDLGNAIAINNAGEITGWASEQGEQGIHSFLWKNGTKTDLGALQGDPCNFGFSINATGQVVGLSVPGCDFNNESAFRAFLSQPGMPMVDLNTLIPPGSALHLSTPATINDRGEISGFGTLNGAVHAFLLIPCGPQEIEGCQHAATGTTLRPSATTRKPANNQSNAIRRMLRRRLEPAYRAPAPSTSSEPSTSGSAIGRGRNYENWRLGAEFVGRRGSYLSVQNRIELRPLRSAVLTDRRLPPLLRDIEM